MPPIFFCKMGQMGNACIFVDGENLRYSICELFKHTFNRNDYLPKRARWAELFDCFAERAYESERIRAYWYAVQHIDFYPYKFPKDLERLQRLLSQHSEYKQELNNFPGSRLASVLADK